MSRTQLGGFLEPAGWHPAQATQPEHGAIFSRFSCPVLDNVVSRGNLARCWLSLWSSHTRLRPEHPETLFLLSVHSVRATQICYQPSAT